LDESIAIESGRAFLEIDERAKKSKGKNPSLFDAIILATSRVNKAKVLTGDLHVKDCRKQSG
jgi:predicted nucleic acid-binding protein